MSPASDRQQRSGPRSFDYRSDRRRNGGRREGDLQPRTTLTKKVTVVIVAGVNFAYLVIEALLNHCGSLLP